MTGPTRDVLTPADIDAILRGGGSAAEKLQRAATMALEKRAMGKDLLTEEELWALASPDVGSFRAKLQAAARLGAEREREQCAELCDHLSTRAGTADDCAAAIRRGEGEQAS